MSDLDAAVRDLLRASAVPATADRVAELVDALLEGLPGPVDPVGPGPIMAISRWSTNGHLIADCAKLGYLQAGGRTLDPTFGLGTFWSVWRPDELVAHDLDPAKSPTGKSVDATDLPYPDRSFHNVVLDGPYKLNGTPSAGIDERYGVHETTHWRERLDLLGLMLVEGARVLGDGYLLYKCQDQVCCGKVRWQTTIFTNLAAELGLGLVDRFDFLSYRAQPNGTRQVTARRNYSTLLVFKRGWRS